MDKNTPANLEWAKDVPCRNITIHGFCKYEGKGCSFRHDRDTIKPASATTTTSTTLSAPADTIRNINNAIDNLEIASKPPSSPVESRKKFNVASSSVFTPSGATSLPKPTLNKFSTLSPKLSDIVSFIPSGIHDDEVEHSSTNLKHLNVIDVPSFQPAASSAPLVNQSPTIPNPYLHQQHQDHSQQQQPVSHINPYAQSHEPLNPYSTMGTTGGQDFMYQPHPQSAYPLQYHLYAPAPPPHLQIPLKGNQQNSEMLFIPTALREALTHKNEATLKTMVHSQLPGLVGLYYDLVPLDTALDRTDRSYGYTSSIYKAFSNTNGRAYALRRIENVKISKDKSLATIHKWMKLRHSNISQVVDAFTTRSFGDNSLIIVYDYYPDSKSLYEYHFRSAISKPVPITLEGLWTYMCQISAAIAVVHSKHIPVRSLTLQKVILTSRNRIRLSDCGVFDILEYDEDHTPEHVEQLMDFDLTMFGKMMLQLASAKLAAEVRNRPPLEIIPLLTECDDEFKSALEYLLNDSNPHRSISEFQRVICTGLYKELNKEQQSADFYEAQLTRELENARLFRLMTKINFILNRPEYELNPQWQQTGPRYPIKLFHEYVFHQVDEKGKPVLDLTHVLRCLNKLDAGIDEKIILVSADEQSCLIVSYKEIKDLIEKSFRDLTND